MTVAIAHAPLIRKRNRTGYLWRRVLQVSLMSKLIGANVVIVAVAIALERESMLAGDWGEVAAVVLALGAACAASLALIRLALRPIDDLAQFSRRVSAGEFDTRVVTSPFADAELATLGHTINALLDALSTERKRIQALGAEVIYAQDAERARVSRELHDSIAQTLAAARYQLSAATTHCPDGETRTGLSEVAALLGTAMEEVRNVSYSLHARVAEDLGLESALDALAAQVRARSGVEVAVESRVVGTSIPRTVVATLFRVAQESLRNIELHSRARTATVAVFARPGLVGVEVTDDGRGFDTSLIQSRRSVTGLASVRDRVNLAGGVMKIDSVADGGTRITAEMRTPQS